MCGLFAVYHAHKAAELTVIGLHGVQHRAINFAGIVSSDGSKFYRERGPGLARQVFSDREMLDRLHGLDALGHIRYPTVKDEEDRDDIQPIMGNYNGMPIAIAHNGNLTNTDELRALLPPGRLSTSMDTEYILRLLEHRCTGSLEEDLASVFKLLKGSFSLVILLPNRLIAVRDPSGCRPLSIGKAENKGPYFVSSETCAFPNVRARHVCDVRPGTMLSINADGMCEIRFADEKLKQCRFEHIYLGLPTSNIFGENVGRFRVALGKELERLFPVPDADIVAEIPDSARFIAMGFAESRRSGRHFPLIQLLRRRDRGHVDRADR